MRAKTDVTTSPVADAATPIALQPVVLRGNLVRLEPMSLTHIDALCEVGLEADLWRFTTTMLRNRADMEQYVAQALQWRAEGTAMPFVTVLQSSQRVIGSTRFANYDAANKRVEIGWTWLNPNWQRTGANVEAKLLMLTHGFDVMGLNRVEFKTDALNEKSRQALKGIGAQEEGVLRQHMVVWDGRLRDSVYFSVIRPEWPEVKARLERRLALRAGYTH